eukprot:scaffold6856_cov124-Isochrysis_galbana.AAC.9
MGEGSESSRVFRHGVSRRVAASAPDGAHPGLSVSPHVYIGQHVALIQGVPCLNLSRRHLAQRAQWVGAIHPPKSTLGSKPGLSSCSSSDSDPSCAPSCSTRCYQISAHCDDVDYAVPVLVSLNGSSFLEGKGVVVYPAAIQYANDLAIASRGREEPGDALEAGAAALVHVHSHALHVCDHGHLNPTAPRPTGDLVAIGWDRASRVPKDPLSQRRVGDGQLRVGLDEGAYLPAQRVGRRPVPQTIAQRVEKARAVARLADDARPAQKFNSAAVVAQLLSPSCTRVRMALPRLAEEGARPSGVRTVALVALVASFVPLPAALSCSWVLAPLP